MQVDPHDDGVFPIVTGDMTWRFTAQPELGLRHSRI